MNVRKMSVESLEANMTAFLGDQRRARANFLICLAEIDRRREWAKQGYSTLWRYVRDKYELKKGTTFQVTTTAHMIQNVPAIEQYLRDGRMTMSSLVVLKDVLTPKNATSLLDRCSGKSKEEVECILAALTGRVVPTRKATIRPLTEDASELRGVVSRTFLAKLERARNILSHSIPDGDVMKVLEKSLDVVIARHEKRMAPTAPRKNGKKPANPRTVPADVARLVRVRDGNKCVWKMANGERCGEAHQIELDHIVSPLHGGRSDPSNLRCLCRAHNQEHARRTFGEAHMSQFVGSSRGTRSRGSPIH